MNLLFSSFLPSCPLLVYLFPSSKKKGQASLCEKFPQVKMRLCTSIILSRVASLPVMWWDCSQWVPLNTMSSNLCVSSYLYLSYASHKSLSQLMNLQIFYLLLICMWDFHQSYQTHLVYTCNFLKFHMTYQTSQPLHFL